MKIYNTYNSQSGFKRVTVVVFLFMIVVVISSLLYFFARKPADNNYQTAATQMNSVTETASILTNTIVVLQDPGHITSRNVEKVENAVNDYQKALGTLATSPVINHDSIIKSTYDQTKSSFEKYKLSLNNLVKSLKLYVAALDSCTQFTHSTSYTDLNVKNSILKACLADLNTGRTADYQAFNDQYLDGYIDNTFAYVEAIVSNINATDKATATTANTIIIKSYDAIQALGKKKIDYSLPIPGDETNKLSSIISTRQNALIR